MTDVEIGTPRDVKHNLHVNNNFDWVVDNPENSFKLEEKLGEGYVISTTITILILCLCYY